MAELYNLFAGCATVREFISGWAVLFLNRLETDITPEYYDADDRGGFCREVGKECCLLCVVSSEHSQPVHNYLIASKYDALLHLQGQGRTRLILLKGSELLSSAL